MLEKKKGAREEGDFNVIRRIFEKLNVSKINNMRDFDGFIRVSELIDPPP